LPLRRDGALPADGRGLVDRGYGAAALGRAAGDESRPLPGWATGWFRVAVALGWGAARLRLKSG
jgi:hypothetical protein